MIRCYLIWVCNFDHSIPGYGGVGTPEGESEGCHDPSAPVLIHERDVCELSSLRHPHVERCQSRVVIIDFEALAIRDIQGEQARRPGGGRILHLLDIEREASRS